MSDRCADLSRAAGEFLAATATTARRWLLLEMPGSWPRDVADPGSLPQEAHGAVSTWLERAPHSRLQFVRRQGRDGRRPLAFVVRSEERRADIRRIELASHAELATVDLETAGERVETSPVLVCAHGSRDACCALRGTAVYGALAERLGDEEVWISSHQGGHRFAANVLVLPAGLQFGRVEVAEAPLLVARALAGRIELPRYRGRTSYEPVVQAAEQAIREAARIEGVAELQLGGVDGSLVRFHSRDGREHAAVVDEVEGPVVPASCSASPVRQRAFRARVL